MIFAKHNLIRGFLLLTAFASLGINTATARPKIGETSDSVDLTRCIRQKRQPSKNYLLYRIALTPKSNYRRAPVYIDRDFSRAERRAIVKALEFLADEIWKHYRQTEDGRSQYEKTVARNTKYGWFGNRRVTSFKTKMNNAYWTMTYLTMSHTKHARTGWPIYIRRVYKKEKFGGRAKIYKTPKSFDTAPLLYIRLNSYVLRKNTDNISGIAGLIFHEFLHNLGLRHDHGYQGSLIQEAQDAITNQGFGLTGGGRVILAH